MFTKGKHEDGQQTAFDENSEVKLCTEGSVVFGSSGLTKNGTGGENGSQTKKTDHEKRRKGNFPKKGGLLLSPAYMFTVRKLFYQYSQFVSEKKMKDKRCIFISYIYYFPVGSNTVLHFYKLIFLPPIEV